MPLFYTSLAYVSIKNPLPNPTIRVSLDGVKTLNFGQIFCAVIFYEIVNDSIFKIVF